VTAVAFDTIKYAEKLEAGGFSPQQAKTESQALADVMSTSRLVTSQDLQIELAPLRTELAVLKWMIGFNTAFTLAILWKVFS
jgi:predicted ATPase